MATSKLDQLEQQAAALLAVADNLDPEQAYLFTTAFDRYQVQLAILAGLEERIAESEPVVEKVYSGGRANLYPSPHIALYNSTSGAADKTCALLLKIVGASMSGPPPVSDPLRDYIERR